MPSSTSSSDIFLASRPVPPGQWLFAAVGALVFLLVFVAFMESRLAARGFDATVVDSDALWLQQRQNASDLGKKALILIGASRVQLDLDLDVFRDKTGLLPVQLAIDGSSFIPVLDGLAQDERVTGTVLVGYQDQDVNSAEVKDRSIELEAAWEQRGSRSQLPDFITIDARLSDALHHHLRSYADGALPLTSLLARVLNHSATPQYLNMLADRSRLADYQRVSMPGFYYSRVVRNLGEEVPVRDGMSWAELDTAIKHKIELLKPVEKIAFAQNTARIGGMAKAIEQRGGRVIFLVMPRSGMVQEMDAKRFPRASFWDDFSRQVGTASLNVDDNPAFSAFQCPDGSHLDYRDRPRFTQALASALELDKQR